MDQLFAINMCGSKSFFPTSFSNWKVSLSFQTVSYPNNKQQGRHHLELEVSETNAVLWVELINGCTIQELEPIIMVVIIQSIG